jgi:hypothetical protein
MSNRFQLRPYQQDDRGGWSVQRFADRHDISKSQAYVEIKEGRLHARKVGTRTVITREDEAEWRRNLALFPIPQK